ncbi:protein translocase subunit SecD [Candidatus Kaiserbacteria bacterium]|nr:protein translocase subunit SecD [Candidatus Kaiserbacteria bacterium]
MSKDNEKTSTQEDSTDVILRSFRGLIVIVAGCLLAYFVYSNVTNPEAKHPFKLGLDLAGGSHLVYEADTEGVAPEDVDSLMSVLRDVIERRVNIFGVSEPIVQVEQSSFVAGDDKHHRLVVELPGVTDVKEAAAAIKATPLLEFKLIDESLMADYENATSSATSTEANDPFVDTGLTGRYLDSAALELSGNSPGQLSNEPLVAIKFNSEGADLFESITRQHTGESLAIFLDGEMVSAPRINETISGGRAVITGNFTLEEAKNLAENLNYGALPLSIELVSTQTVGASLGGGVLNKGIEAGVIGFSFVMLFMVFWYRLPGFVASIALLVYLVSMMSLFMLIPVTLTAAGLAGFILSIGMAVDANVLVFERMKEEYQNGSPSREAARTGFTRAWSAIRDGNITSLLSAIILFWFGTSMVKGFALVFGIGVVMSMLTAIVVTRTLLIALPSVKKSEAGLLAKLYKTGLK